MLARLKQAGLEPILLSNGDVIVLPANTGYATIKRPPERLPEYTPQEIAKAIAFVNGFGKVEYACNNLNLFEDDAR